MLTTIYVPTREEASASNQAIFDSLRKGLGMVPNLYATFAHSETALAPYITLQNAKSSIAGKAREVVNLVVSQVNECQYCLAAHTMLAKVNGFTDAQILEIRHGHASFDAKFDALARLTKGITQSRGHVDQRTNLHRCSDMSFALSYPCHVLRINFRCFLDTAPFCLT